MDNRWQFVIMKKTVLYTLIHSPDTCFLYDFNLNLILYNIRVCKINYMEFNTTHNLVFLLVVVKVLSNVDFF